ncbi:MAG: RrF2 family transcriptional regulator [Cellulosilyticaceae bacterium]
MKLSTKGRYGLQVMVYLGVHATEKHMSLKSIAERLELSDNYLEQLIALLKKNELVGSIRGAQGGYFLKKDPQDITIGQILRALEGSLAPTECSFENNKHKCTKAGQCVTQSVWEKIRDGINNVVDSITLQEMIDDAKNLGGYSCNI